MKNTFIRLILSALVLTCILLAGCSLLQQKLKNNDPQKTPGVQQESQNPQEKLADKPGDYFPLTKNSYWEYQGEGNEYASFNRKVVFTDGNRAQIKEDNGGTISTSVFETTDSAVTRIFFQGEAYNDVNLLDQPANDNTIILKTPLAVSTKWGQPNTGAREIIDVNATIVTPAGTFDKCIKVKITSTNSTLFEYFKSGVGMVKREFVSGEARVMSTLSKYEIK